MTWSSILGEMVAGWLFADFVGGIVHWWEDRIAKPHWPIIGRYVVSPNRDHHDRPHAFTANGVLRRNDTTWVLVVALTLVWSLVAGMSVTLAAAFAGGMLTGQVHYWAHVPTRAPVIVRALQSAGIFQSPGQHARHHRPPAAVNYCVLTDLLNPLLTACGFWDRVERALARAGVCIEKTS